MVIQPINKRRYLVALLLTLVIFSLGLLIGYGITGVRLQYAANIAEEQQVAYDSLQVQTLYTSSLLTKEDCPALSNTLEKNINDVEITAKKLEDFIKNSNSKEDFTSLKRQYALSQIRYWLLAQEVNKICKKDSILVLYFYSVGPELCDTCTTQGVILSYLKDELKEKFLVFSFDANFRDEPLISLLKTNYNITTTPSLVINEKLYEGLVTKDVLLHITCSSYIEKPDFCP